MTIKWYAVGRQIRDKPMDIPSKLASQLAAEKDVRNVREMLDTEIAAILKALSLLYSRRPAAPPPLRAERLRLSGRSLVFDSSPVEAAPRRAVEGAAFDSWVERYYYLSERQSLSAQRSGIAATRFVGYIIDRDAGPTLVVQPRVDDGKSWSKDRLAPMLRDTPCLRGKVSEVPVAGRR